MLLHQMRIRKLIVFCNSDTIEDKWSQQNHNIASWDSQLTFPWNERNMLSCFKNNSVFGCEPEPVINTFLITVSNLIYKHLIRRKKKKTPKNNLWKNMVIKTRQLWSTPTCALSTRLESYDLVFPLLPLICCLTMSKILDVSISVSLSW